MVNVKDVIEKYNKKLEGEISSERTSPSKDYMKFKEELSQNPSTYEKLAKGAGSLISLKIKDSEKKKTDELLTKAHLDISAQDAAAFSLLAFLGTLLFFILIFGGMYFIGSSVPLLIMLLGIIISAFVYFYTSKLPEAMFRKWRIKAGSQMVPAILYVVIYMKHTSNLERAIKFASDHLHPPLSLDFKKILWDVETGKYSTIKDSLDAYLENWRDYSMEFVEAFHLIESSLYEPSDSRRVAILEKSLSVILEGIYDKMLKYTHEVQSPLTNLYMLGIVLPTLALALLPLASTLMRDAIQWWHIAIAFNILLPFFVYYMTSEVLAKRPGGYGDNEMLELNPNYGYYKSSQHYYKALAVAVPLFIIGIIPWLFYFNLFSVQDMTFKEIGIGLPTIGDMQVFGFSGGKGPFGLGALILSFFIPLSIASFFFIAYKSKTIKLVSMKEETQKLEKEFASSLFQLGNRLGDGVPVEMAFGRVAESLKGTPTEGFFKIVNSNIRQLGMSVKESIFNPNRGAIIYYPSELIRTSMEIMIESTKKGLQVGAGALMSISQYMKNIYKINERLKDLLAEIISSMKSNMAFLAPLLAGIVVGLTAMITTILSKLSSMIASTASGENVEFAGASIGQILEIFDLNSMLPPYWLQIVVGIYLIEIIYILTITLVSVESGVDELGEKAEIAGNMRTGIMLYIVSALAASIILSLLAGIATAQIG